MNLTAETMFLYFKRLFYLIKNNISYILWFIFYFVLAFLSLSSDDLISEEEAFVICVILYAVSIFVALVFGEKILKLINGVRPIETKEEKEYLLPLFESVKTDALRVCPNLPKIELYIIDKMSINACAIGKHTVAVTKGAIATFTEEELQGVILHEFAHIYYGNTTAEILNKIGNGFFTVYIICVNFFFMILDLLFTDLDDTDTGHLSGLFRTLFWFIRMSINLSVFLILFVGNVILSGNSRKNELRADRFAYDTGYGEDLKSALYLLQKISLGENSHLIEKLCRKHPRISKRIAQLESLLDNETLQDMNI